jgi:hypothetical protein
MLGCEWHAAQLSALKRGPRPEPGAPFTVPDTESISWKIARRREKLLLQCRQPGQRAAGARGAAADAGV